MKKIIISSVLFFFVILANAQNVGLITNKTEACEGTVVTLSVSVDGSYTMDPNFKYFLQRSDDNGSTWKTIEMTNSAVNVPISSNYLFKAYIENNTGTKFESNQVAVKMLKLIDFQLPEVIDSICGEFNLEDLYLYLQNQSGSDINYYQHWNGKHGAPHNAKPKAKTSTTFTVAEGGGCNCPDPTTIDPFNPPANPPIPDPSDPTNPSNPQDPNNPSDPSNPQDPNNPGNPSTPSNPVTGLISYHDLPPSNGKDYSHEIQPGISGGPNGGSQTIYVMIATPDGKFGLDSVKLNFLSENECCPELFIPNSFSPNGDGVNDYFEVKGLDCYDKATLEVFNQWGKLVYKQDNYGVSGWWNGSVNQGGNTDLTATTYYFLLNLEKNGKTKVHKGYVYINR